LKLICNSECLLGRSNSRPDEKLNDYISTQFTYSIT